MRISDWSSDVCSSDLPRPPVPGEVCRRPEHHDPEFAEMPGSQARIRQITNSHRQVEAFLEKVHVTVRNHQPELHLSLVLHEVADHGRDIRGCEQARRGDPEKPRRLADPVDGFQCRPDDLRTSRLDESEKASKSETG